MTKKKHKKLSLKEVLEIATESELKAYLAQYAKKDAGFEVALKAHFVSRLVTGDEDNKYYRILSEVIKPRTLANDKLTQRTKKVTDMILMDLTFQMEDLLSTDNYREAYFVIKNCLDKIAYLQHKYLWQSKSIERYRVTFLEGLDILIRKDIAPRFRAQLEKDMKLLVMKSYFLPATHDIWHVMTKNEAWDGDAKYEITKNLLEKYKEGYVSQQMITLLLLLGADYKEIKKKVLFDVNHTDVFKGLMLLIELGYPREAALYIEDNIESGYSYNNTIVECILLHETNDFEALTEALQNLSTDTYDSVGLDLLIRHLSQDYLQSHYKKLNKWISTLAFKTQCDIYAKVQAFKKLIKNLTEKDDVEWVRVYDQILVDNDLLQELETLYLSLITDHLDNHVGDKANRYVTRVYERLQMLSQVEIRKNIQQALYDRYANQDSVDSDL